ncbi:hypothetical protein [Streptomyces sp. NPDC020917]|uniref:hypothetical protein n=1 Tax=Streptomyces sp. NPDC020917 TaxID=3365102 RepID=UPI00379F81DB
MRRVGGTDLRLAAAVAEVEGLYAALLRARSSRRRAEVQAELSRAADRLARLAAVPREERSSADAVTRSRWGRRRALAEHGARWIMARFGAE